MIFSFSCTDQENVSKADDQAVLIENLQQFNESLITSEKESRSFMSFLCVASADVAGAYELGRICGRAGLFVGKNVLESKEFIDSYNTLIPKYATLSVDEFLSGETVDSKVMSLFLDIYNAYPENIQDVKFIINKYIELIEASDSFTDDEKQSIYAGLSVAVCSYEYWENNNNLYLK